ncbi:MAG: hypothetical protein NVSMB53_12730 [Gemmatimonadaceae bacterium]
MSHKGPWVAGKPVAVGSGAMIETAAWLLERLPALGVVVPQGSRLYLARKLIDRVHNRKIVLKVDDTDVLRAVSDAHRTLTEYYIIVRAIQSRRALIDAHLREKLTLMLGGAELESSDSNSLHRDIQFELYVLAMFIMGGATVELGEPDLRLLFGSDFVGVAVKRLSSPKQLEKRVAEAADQIETRREKGFIAVNLDRFVMDMGGPKPDEDVSDRGKEFEERITHLTALTPRLADRPLVLGSMNLGHSAHWSFEGETPRYSEANFRQVLRFASSAAEREQAEEYFDTLSARIDNALRLL